MSTARRFDLLHQPQCQRPPGAVIFSFKCCNFTRTSSQFVCRVLLHTAIRPCLLSCWLLPRVITCSRILLSIIHQYTQRTVPSGLGTVAMCVPIWSMSSLAERSAIPLYLHIVLDCACALVVHYNFARDEFVAQHIAAPRSVVLLAPVCAHFSCSEERHVNHTLLLCLGEVPKRHSVTSEEAVHYFRLAFLSDQTWHGVNQPLCVENNEVVATRHTWEIDHHAELLEHLQKHLNLDLRSG